MTDNVEQLVIGAPTEQQLRYLPEGARESMYHYIVSGRPVGSFLASVLSNNLMDAAANADDVNKFCLFDYAYFLFNWAPMGCHSSPEAYRAWMKQGGLRGLYESTAAAAQKASAGNTASGNLANPEPSGGA